MVATITTVQQVPVVHMGLRDFINRVTNTFIDKARQNKTHFVNEIPDHLQLEADPHILGSVLSGLFLSVVSHAKESCIRIAAKVYGNVVLLKLKDSNGPDIYGIEDDVKKLKPLAEKMRGSVNVTGQRKKLATITLGFPNVQYSKVNQ